jgi:hypothetical protein
MKVTILLITLVLFNSRLAFAQQSEDLLIYARNIADQFLTVYIGNNNSQVEWPVDPNLCGGR